MTAMTRPHQSRAFKVGVVGARKRVEEPIRLLVNVATATSVELNF
jgi:hypothetical protein